LKGSLEKNDNEKEDLDSMIMLVNTIQGEKRKREDEIRTPQFKYILLISLFFNAIQPLDRLYKVKQ